MKTKKIAIIGNGNIGQAVFYLLNSGLNNKDADILVYDKEKIKNKSKKNLKECVLKADFVFLCIPSWTEEEVLFKIAPYVNERTILISLAKGLNTATKKSIDELIEKDVKNANYGLLSGPMFAKEIQEGKMSYGVLATKNKIVFKKVSELFANTKLKIEHEKDVHSVAISAVLKNIYTLMFGMLDGFGERYNTEGFLASRSISEMMKIMKILKLNEKIILGTAGMGDFIATSSSEYSQNRKLGKEIFKKGHASFKSEGFVSFSSLLKMLGEKSKDLPILSLLKRILMDKKNPKKEIEKFLKEI